MKRIAAIVLMLALALAGPAACASAEANFNSAVYLLSEFFPSTGVTNWDWFSDEEGAKSIAEVMIGYGLEKPDDVMALSETAQENGITILDLLLDSNASGYEVVLICYDLPPSEAGVIGRGKLVLLINCGYYIIELAYSTETGYVFGNITDTDRTSMLGLYTSHAFYSLTYEDCGFATKEYTLGEILA